VVQHLPAHSLLIYLLYLLAGRNSCYHKYEDNPAYHKLLEIFQPIWCVHVKRHSVLELYKISSPNFVCKSIGAFPAFANEEIRHFWKSEAASAAIFTARRCASAATSRRCVSVRLSHAGVVSKRLNVGSRKQRHVIAPGI